MIFFHCDTQYDSDQTAVGTIHVLTILTSLVRPFSRRRQGEWGVVECKLYIVIIIVLRFYMEVLYILITRGQYYWILGALLGSVLTLNVSQWNNNCSQKWKDLS